jgi:hypothetical protein
MGGMFLAWGIALNGGRIMADQVKILGIAGSLRKASYNRGALRAAQQLCPQGATIEAFELDGIPAFNQDEERNPPQKSLISKAASARRTPSCSSRLNTTTACPAC